MLQVPGSVSFKTSGTSFAAVTVFVGCYPTITECNLCINDDVMWILSGILVIVTARILLFL